MAEITNPHDRFFRAVLGQANMAAGFAANYLLPPIVAHLDLGNLDPQPGSYWPDSTSFLSI